MRTSWTKSDMIDSLASAIERFYVIPAVGTMMADTLRGWLNRGEFDSIKDGDTLLLTVNRILQNISEDAHLRVSWLDPEEDLNHDGDGVTDSDLAQWKAENFGFRRIEIPDGNIGYLDLREFRDTTYASKTLVAVSDFLANSDALIVDLRRCRGGRPEMVQLLASYFVSKPTLLSKSYDRYDDASTEMWSLPSIAGTPLYELPIVIIVGPRTVSAGEGFASTLMRLGRVKVVGEKTAGAGHMARIIDFPSIDIRLKLPTGAPADGHQIQGAGIRPDISASAEKALLIAHAEALKAAAEQSSDELKARKMIWLADGLIAESNPIELSTEDLRKYLGKYDQISVILDSTGLHAKEGDLPVVHLIPFSKHTFTAKEHPENRLQFAFGRDDSKASKVVVMSSNGQTMELKRTGD